ncbi:MAG: hypothetical protein JKY96_06410 [Phycisphaerales bacterium]|nr:hypothetical protein [Phycisphaerales bacterium]
MIHRFKRLNAFMTGCLVSTVVFGYPAQLLAQSNMGDDPIQGVTSTTQLPPATTAEMEDAIAGIEAGLSPIDAIGYKSYPIREHTAFLSDLWDVHFQADFVYNTSGLHFDSWIPNGTGSLEGQSETGVAFTADILFSVNAPLDDRIGIADEDLAILEATDTSFGVAWLEISTETASTRIFGIWMEQTDVENTTHAAFVPITTISVEDWDNLLIALPSLLEDIETFWDTPVHRGAWSSFRNAMKTAAKVAVLAIVVIAIVAVVVVAAPAVAAAAGIAMGGAMTTAIGATAGVVATSVIVASQFADDTKQNIQDLRDALQDALDNLPYGIGDNIDLDSMTDAEIVQMAEDSA